MKRVSVVVPAYNEADRISATVSAIRRIPGLHEVIVVDDGSTDGTAEVAKQAGADIVSVPANAGKGAALRRGLSLVTGDVLLLLDADLGDTAFQGAYLLEPVVNGYADMTIATFPVIPGKGGGIGVVVRLSRWGIQKLTGQRMIAPLSGQRAISIDLMRKIGGFAEGWGVEVDLTVRAIRCGYSVVEVPTTMDHRVTGRSYAAILHRSKQFVAAARVLSRLWRQYGSFTSAEPTSR